MSTLDIRMRLKRDTEANWLSVNPVLLDGEMAISTDKGYNYKIGDGVSLWSDLSYNEPSEELLYQIEQLDNKITKVETKFNSIKAATKSDILDIFNK